MSTIQLTFEEPKPTDIFRVYRANHPETLTFNAPSRATPAVPSFQPKTSVTLEDHQVTKPVSVVPLLVGPAQVSAATRQINLVCDVNEMLADNNFEAAEELLGRKLTDEEKQTKLIADKWAPIKEQAAKAAEFEDLKEKARLSRKQYEEALAQWAAASTKAAKDDALKIAAIRRARAAAMIIAKRKAARDLSAAGNSSMTDDDDSDSDSAVNNSLPPLPGSGSDSDSDDDSVASTVVGNSSSSSIAPTVVAPTHGVTSLYVFPWMSKPQKPLKKDYQARASDLVDNYPELEPILKGYHKSKTTLAELERMVNAAQDELARKHAEETGKKQAKNIAEAAKQAQTSGDGSSSSVPLAGNGLFTGLRKIKNHMNYVKFGPRFLVDLKRLKDKGQFSLVYPKSGQKPNQIRDAVLTPHLKEVVLAYLDGQPQDTTDLDEKEMAWLKLVWQQTGLQKPKPKLYIAPKRNKGKADLKARLKVLMGECLAGNDNPAVLTEMSEIVDKLEDRKWISEKDIINSRRFISGE